MIDTSPGLGVGRAGPRSLGKRSNRATLHLSIVVAVFSVLSTLLGRSFTAFYPGGDDAMFFAYVGEQWLSGVLPYTRIWDNKPPGIFAINAAVLHFAPWNFRALAAMEALVTLACVATVFFLLRRWGAPERVAALASMSTAAIANLACYTHHGNMTEVYLLFPAVLSMYCFTRSAPHYSGAWVFAAGVCTGVASEFKQVGLVPLLAQCLSLCLLAYPQRGKRLREVFASCALNTIGVFAAWLPSCIYFWRHSALREMFNACVVNIIYYGESNQKPLLVQLLTLAKNLQPMSAVAACAAIGLVLAAVAWFRRPNEQTSPVGLPYWTLTSLWLIADMAGVMAGGRFYDHYFLVLAPSIATMAALVYWHWTAQDSVVAGSPSRSAGLFAVILLPVLFVQADDLLAIVSHLRHPPPPTHVTRVADYIKRTHRPPDSLFVWNYAAPIYFDTRLRTATTQMFAYRVFEFPKSRSAFVKQIFDDLNRHPATVIVDGTSNTDPWSADPIYIAFRDFLAVHYREVYELGSYKVYEFANR